MLSTLPAVGKTAFHDEALAPQTLKPVTVPKPVRLMRCRPTALLSRAV